jgi:hypothetical protein
MITNIITQEAGKQQPTSVLTIIKCDHEGCDKVAQFEQSTQQQALTDHPWLRTYRSVNTGDQRSFGYCSDVCEVKAVETGKHNIPEPPKIVASGNAAEIAAAAQAAANARKQEAAIRDGKPAKVQLS